MGSPGPGRGFRFLDQRWMGGYPRWRTLRRRCRLRYVLLILGGLMDLVGVVWLLQGLGVLPGSFMTGQPFWAVMGAILLVLGGLLVFVGLRSG
jgi:hypothetical protein